MRPSAMFVLVGIVGCFVALLTYKLTAPATGAENPVRAAVAKASRHPHATTPSAREFGRRFVRMMNAYALTQHDRRRLADAHCVQAARGRYMCAYRVVKPGGRSECHLMQAHWKTGLATTLQVTRAGRAARCGTVREAVRSLR